jgi:hypothetical protein
VWDQANDRERHVLVEDLLDAGYVHPGHLRVVACGARPARSNSQRSACAHPLVSDCACRRGEYNPKYMRPLGGVATHRVTAPMADVRRGQVGATTGIPFATAASARRPS